MVTAILQPLTIFLLGLGGGFLIPLVYRVAKPLPAIVFLVALSGMTLISGFQLWRLMNGEPTIEIYTAGALPPFSINLRFGLWEGFFAFSVNVAAMIGAWQLWERMRGTYAALLLYLILVMGINGMVMTRDLFNQFVFLEIVSIATYGLLGMERGGAMLSASFKYIMATVLASSAFLLGAVLLYHVTGTLNIDDMIEHRASITGPIGTTALLLVLSGLILELKPFPANGWGLDVYETAPAALPLLSPAACRRASSSRFSSFCPSSRRISSIIAVGGRLVVPLLQSCRPAADEGSAAARLFVDRADGAVDAGACVAARAWRGCGDAARRRWTVLQSSLRESRPVLARWRG